MKYWLKFKSYKKGYFAFLIFAGLAIITSLAELIANDKPLAVWHQSSLYLPFVEQVPESVFGADTDSPTNYKDPFIQANIEQTGWLIFTIIPYSANSIDYTGLSFPSPPDSKHWLGTDDQGRDILARLIYGYRTSILFAFLLTLFSSLIGVMVGLIQGYYGGLVDLLGQRIVEIWSGIPTLFLLILVSSAILIDFWLLLFLMLLLSWTELVHFVRAETLKVKNYQYVLAAKALGANDWAIMLRHILPNALVSTLSMLPFVFTAAVATLTALDFLGFGLPAGEPSLGDIINQAKQNMHAPWIAWCAFVSITLLLTLIIFIGEALRDTFNPQIGTE